MKSVKNEVFGGSSYIIDNQILYLYDTDQVWDKIDDVAIIDLLILIEVCNE